MHKISIVLPCWFTPSQHGKSGELETYWFAAECLKRLLEATPRDAFELIMVDNGSTLTDDDVVASWSGHSYAGKYADVRDVILPSWYWKQADVLVRNATNLGFAPAVNQGISKATCDYVCVLNNDILVWPGWEKAMLDAFEMPLSPKPGAVMPGLIVETSDPREAIALKSIDLSRNRGKVGPKGEFGSLFVMPRALMSKIASRRDGYQVLDENFKIGMGEDRWLWQEIRLEGYETYKTHFTRVYHRGQMTMSKVEGRKDISKSNHEYLDSLKRKNGLT